MILELYGAVLETAVHVAVEVIFPLRGKRVRYVGGDTLPQVLRTITLGNYPSACREK